MLDFLLSAPIGGSTTDWIIYLLTLCVPVALAAVLTYTGAGAWLRRMQTDTLEKAVARAYLIVESVSKSTTNTIDDKLAVGLGYLQQILAAEKSVAVKGLVGKDGELTTVAIERAKLFFEVLHGAGKVKSGASTLGKLELAAGQAIPSATEIVEMAAKKAAEVAVDRLRAIPVIDVSRVSPEELANLRKSLAGAKVVLAEKRAEIAQEVERAESL